MRKRLLIILSAVLLAMQGAEAGEMDPSVLPQHVQCWPGSSSFVIMKRSETALNNGKAGHHLNHGLNDDRFFLSYNYYSETCILRMKYKKGILYQS